MIAIKIWKLLLKEKIKEKIEKNNRSLNNVKLNNVIIPGYQNHYLNSNNNNNNNNKVLDYTLSNDIKHLLPIYSCPEYYNEKTKKGVVRDADELMTGNLLKLK